MKVYRIRVGEKSVTLTPLEGRNVKPSPLPTVVKNALFTVVLGEKGEVGIITAKDVEEFKERFKKEIERVSNLRIIERKSKGERQGGSYERH